MRNMKGTFFLIIFLSVNISVFSQKIILKTARNKQQKSLVKSIDKNNFYINLSLKSIEFKNNISKNGNFVNLKNNKLIRNYDIGSPNLPVYSKLIEIPQNATVKIKIVSFDQETINLNSKGIKEKIFPAQNSAPKNINPIDVPFKINKKIYTTNAFYSNKKKAEFKIIGQMREKRLGRITIYPFAYNPITNQLKVYNNIVVKISFENPDWAKTKALEQKYSSPFFPQTDASIINPAKSGTKELIQSLPVTYVIVSDPSFKTALQPFIKWKREKGFHVIEAYTDDSSVGTTVAKIKAYLKNLYYNPAQGVSPPSFILLVGDIDKIPATQHTEVSDSPYSDLDYAEYTGDYLPEVYYGRFSADSASQVTDIVNKTIKYEKYQMPNPAYLGQTLLVAGNDEEHEDTYGGGAIWYAANYYLNSNNNIYSHTFLQKTIETWGGNDEGNLRAHDSIIADINKGVALANYTAHCSPNGWSDPSFSQNDLNNYITNTDKYGIWIGNCCQSNEFEKDECFGELALRKPNAGVIGYIGGTQYTYWDEDYFWGVGYGAITEQPTYSSTGEGVYDGIFHNKTNEENDISKWFITSDQLIRAGDLAVQASGSSLAPYYWVIYTLMGDPSLMPYIGVPTPLTFSLNQQDLVIGKTSFSSIASPYSYIAFSQDNQLKGVGYADKDGFVTINLSSPLTASPVEIVATAQFKQPYIHTFTPISTDQPYVLCDSINTPTLHNGDYSTMSVFLVNYGKSGYDASKVHVSLSSSDSLISIIDSTADISKVIAQDTLALRDSFSFKLNFDIPDQYLLPITITVKDSANTITKTQNYLIINSPAISSIKTSIDDSPAKIAIMSNPKTEIAYGKSYVYNIIVSYPFLNHQLDAGEDVILSFKTTNKGHAGISNLYSLLTSSSEYISIEHAKFQFDSIKADSSIINNYKIHVDKTNLNKYYAGFRYVFGDSIYQDTLNFVLPVNLIFDDFESANFRKFDWHFSGEANWTVTKTKHYSGSFSALSGKIPDNSSSSLYIDLDNVKAGQQISFYYSTSSEQDYDYLKFEVNDSLIDQWSGLTPWQKYTYTFKNSGDFEIKFTYQKDESTSSFSDCAWIDDVEFPVIPKGSEAPVTSTITAPVLPDWTDFTDYGNGTALISGTAPNGDFNDSVRIEATDGTLFSSQKFIIQIKAVSIEDTNKGISIYPNPTSNFLNIKIETNFNFSDLLISDMNGRTVLHKTLYNTNNSIDINNLEKGIYLLKLNIDGKFNTYKIIIN